MTDATTKVATDMPNKIWACTQISLINRWSRHEWGAGTIKYVRADIATTEADALRAEVKRLREALKFYAPIEIAGVKYAGGDDAGWRATAALAKATQ